MHQAVRSGCRSAAVRLGGGGRLPLLAARPLRAVAARAVYGATLPLLSALPAAQQEKVELYVSTLLAWNEKMNLVAASQASREQILERHVEDSLTLLDVISAAVGPERAAGPLRLIDVGTGAGLPGVVLAIARPHWKVTLLDSLAKRVKFLDDVVASTPLDNATTVWGRSEEVARTAVHREQYDVVVARAVAELRILAELCLPFARPGGVWVAAKGPDARGAELAAAARAVSLLGGGVMSVSDVATMGPDGLRPFIAVTCTKPKRTPELYPRSPGTPKSDPL